MPTPIELCAGGTAIPAVLNDTVAARDFKRRLPVSVSVRRSAGDSCCPAASGIFDPAETQSGWEAGDISLTGGWLELWLGGEGPAPCRSLMVIAHIDEAALPLVRRLPDPARLTIRLAETADGKQG